MVDKSAADKAVQHKSIERKSIENKPIGHDADIVIVGGGAIGCAMALAIVKTNPQLAVVIVEANKAEQQQVDSFDSRILAISYGSKEILQSLNVWSELNEYATPIEHIHVSDRGHAGQARLHHNDYQLTALGYVIELQKIGQAFLEQLSNNANIKILQPETVRAIDTSKDDIRLTLTSGSGVTAKLLLAADGGNSKTRELLKIESESKPYNQSALIANIRLQRAHQNWAYERFTSSGPIALLPMQDNLCSLVWTLSPDEAERISELPEKAFLAELQSAFGYRAGKMQAASARHVYPLSLVTAQQQIQHRAIILGNASHTLHPIAGQGFNLGLRDVSAMQSILQDQELALGEYKMLSGYLQLRENDQQNVIGITDAMVRVFSNDFLPMVVGRNLGLVGMQLLQPIKDKFAYQAMGMNQ